MSTNIIIDSLKIGMLAVDTQCRITLINKYAKNILEINEKKTTDIALSDIFPEAVNIIKKSINTGYSLTEASILRKGVNIVALLSPAYQNNRISGVLFIFSEKKIFEHFTNKLESYKNLKRELDAIFFSSAYGNWVCDSSGTVLKVNKIAEELVGIKHKDIVGKKAWYLLENGYVDCSVTGEVIRQKSRVFLIQHALKTKKDIMNIGTPVFNDSGDIFRIIVNNYDITEINSIRKELQLSQSVTEKYKNELFNLSMLELEKSRIVAESKSMKQVLFTSLKLSKTEASEILILGESGVGKGLLAKFIHKNSERRKESFIQINCAALPESLLEAELFGYEKGAYTGARNRGKTGLIEIAQNGTLFLDEIGEMPLPLQAKLLTYLDDYLIRPLGSIREKKVPCSVIAATNKDLSDLVKQGRFRDDLFFRINTFTLKIPPLRKRPEDIFGLANLFLQKFNDQYGQNRNISSKFLKILRSYDFPGNVRELESLIKQAVVMSEDEELDDFILTNFGNNCNGPNDRPNPDWGLTQQVKNFEKKLLQEALTHNKTTRKIAASLGISQSAVVKKLKKHGLSRPLIP